MTIKTPLHLAVLIDGDNAQPNTISPIMAEIKKYGEPIITHVYANWPKPTKGPWKNAIEKEGLIYIEQQNPKPGKNATDIALVIDAMDILYTKEIEGFFIVSSDGDFTSLALRIREKGKSVFGFGRKNTPSAFMKACNRFIFVEDLPIKALPPAVSKTAYSQKLIEICKKAFELAQKGGWATLSAFGSSLYKIEPGFKPQDYGMAANQLSKMIEKMDQLFEIKKNAGAKGAALIRIKTH